MEKMQEMQQIDGSKKVSHNNIQECRKFRTESAVRPQRHCQIKAGRFIRDRQRGWFELIPGYITPLTTASSLH